MKKLLLTALFSINLSIPVQAEPTNETLCPWVLQYSTGLAATPIHEVSPDLEAFAEAKSSADPLRVVQFATGDPVNSIACKVRSVEGLQAYGGFAASEMGVQRSCRETHAQILAEVTATLAPDESTLSPEDIVLDEDLSAWMGPQWLKPLNTLYRGADGRLHLQARELAVSSAWYIPLPDSIKGVHYCYLVAPDFLRSVLRGEVIVND